MFIELVDTLRCPNPHEESWLVLATSVLAERHIREGLLGCPVCLAEYPVRGGVVDFRNAAELAAAASAPQAASTALARRRTSGRDDEPRATHWGSRCWSGRWGTRAEALLDLVDGPPLLLVDPPPDVAMHSGLSGIRCGPALPLAQGAARAIAVDSVDPKRVDSAVNATRVGGRIVAPAALRFPTACASSRATKPCGSRSARPGRARSSRCTCAAADRYAAALSSSYSRSMTRGRSCRSPGASP